MKWLEHKKRKKVGKRKNKWEKGKKYEFLLPTKWLPKRPNKALLGTFRVFGLPAELTKICNKKAKHCMIPSLKGYQINYKVKPPQEAYLPCLPNLVFTTFSSSSLAIWIHNNKKPLKCIWHFMKNDDQRYWFSYCMFTQELVCIYVCIQNKLSKLCNLTFDLDSHNMIRIMFRVYCAPGNFIFFYHFLLLHFFYYSCT